MLVWLPARDIVSLFIENDAFLSENKAAYAAYAYCGVMVGMIYRPLHHSGSCSICLFMLSLKHTRTDSDDVVLHVYITSFGHGSLSIFFR